MMLCLLSSLWSQLLRIMDNLTIQGNTNTKLVSIQHKHLFKHSYSKLEIRTDDDGYNVGLGGNNVYYNFSLSKVNVNFKTSSI